MLEYLEKITPILRELDDVCVLNKPVGVTDHLLPLFKKFSDYSEIEIIPITPGGIAGFHIGQSKVGRAIIFPMACAFHTDIDPACLECQWHRLTAAKELVHALDTEQMRTPPDELAENIIDQLIKGAIDDNIQVHADGMAIFWAIELLVRFRHRVLLTRVEHSAIQSARKKNDWSFIARQYGVPAVAAKIAFSDSHMDGMRAVREAAGLSVEMASIPDWDVGN